MKHYTIVSKYRTVCAGSGLPIVKGQAAVYFPDLRAVYLPKYADKFLASIDPAADMIQANEDAYFDNFVQQNNI